MGGDGNDYLQGNGVSTQIFGGNGNDQIRLAGKRTTVDAGPGDDLITAITSSGSGTVKCGPGNDTVMVSRFKGNAKRVKIAKDCEKKKGEARSRKAPARRQPSQAGPIAASRAVTAHSHQIGADASGRQTRG